MTVQSDLPVSAPGAMSSRTDLGPTQGAMQLPDPAYGEQKDFQAIQGGAPMAASPSAPQIPLPTGLMEPTQRPNEPLTEGSPVGAGANALPAGNPDVFTQDTSMLAKYLPQLERLASDESAPKSFRLFVQYVRGGR